MNKLAIMLQVTFARTQNWEEVAKASLVWDGYLKYLNDRNDTLESHENYKEYENDPDVYYKDIYRESCRMVEYTEDHLQSYITENLRYLEPILKD